MDFYNNRQILRKFITKTFKFIETMSINYATYFDIFT
jgi:hypothetical protein